MIRCLFGVWSVWTLHPPLMAARQILGPPTCENSFRFSTTLRPFQEDLAELAELFAEFDGSLEGEDPVLFFFVF